MAQGSPPADAGLQVDKSFEKVLKKAGGGAWTLLDEVSRLATTLNCVRTASEEIED